MLPKTGRFLPGGDEAEVSGPSYAEAISAKPIFQPEFPRSTSAGPLLGIQRACRRGPELTRLTHSGHWWLGDFFILSLSICIFRIFISVDPRDGKRCSRCSQHSLQATACPQSERCASR